MTDRIKWLTIKSHTEPHTYRTLNLLDNTLFPINYYRAINPTKKDAVLSQILGSGIINTNELREKFYAAANGETNEFSNLIKGSTIANDQPESLYIGIAIFGIISMFLLYKIIKV